MDATQARQVAFRLAAINDLLPRLEDLDLTEVGLEGWLTSEVAGVVTNVPFIGAAFGAMLDWMGLEPSEIIKAQTARAGFFRALGPLAESIVNEEGERRLITTRTGRAFAEEVLTITNLSTKPESARIAVNKLIDMFTTMRDTLQIQLKHKTMVRPVITTVGWKTDTGAMKGLLLEEDEK